MFQVNDNYPRMRSVEKLQTVCALYTSWINKMHTNRLTVEEVSRVRAGHQDDFCDTYWSIMYIFSPHRIYVFCFLLPLIFFCRCRLFYQLPFLCFHFSVYFC